MSISSPLSSRSRESSILVLGCGCYRIGSSVEVDWCACRVYDATKPEPQAIVMNCNSEMVTTDADESDCLYFEGLSHENVLEMWTWKAPAESSLRR